MEGGRREGGGRRREGRGEGCAHDLTGVIFQDEVATLLARKEELKDAVVSAERERDAAKEKHK